MKLRFMMLRCGMALGGLASMIAACELEPLQCKPSECSTGSGATGGGGGAPYQPSAPIDVRRDHQGVVHVYAASDGDVAYGDGYMQATDRLFQMDLQRRRALGRRSEVLGADSEGDDRITRILGIPSRGHENAEAMRTQHPDTYALIEAWVAGVNARIAEVNAGTAPMPSGFTELGYAPEPFAIDDPFSIGKLLVFGNASQLEFDVLATAIHEFDPELFAALPFFKPIENEFVLDTANGPLASLMPRTDTGSLGVARSPGVERALPADAAERLARFHHLLEHLRPKASNNFAVDGRHTASGHSLIAGDPHQDLESPSLMWLHHMNSLDGGKGGTLDVVGWSFVGTPGVSLGHNRDVAWTATTNYPDVTDLWDVAVTDGKASIAGTDVAVVSHTETFSVKDGGTVEVVVEEVPGYGILLPDELIPLPLVPSGHRILFDWTGFRPTFEARTFLLMDQAKTVDDFDAAVDTMELGSFNWVAATRDEITYRSSPLVPDRGNPVSHAPPYYMMSGDDASSFWPSAFLAGDQLPHSRATQSGLIVTANNDPFGFTEDGSLSNDPFYFGAYFDPGCRSSRIHQEIESLLSEKKLVPEDFEAVQSDTHSLIADRLLPVVEATYAKVATDPALARYKNRPDLDQLAALLHDWDRRFERSEAGPVAFEVFQDLFTRDVIADDMGLFFQPVLGQEPIYTIKYALIAFEDPAGTFVQEGKDQVVMKALDETATFLEDRYGSTRAGFTWGDFHATAFGSESTASFDGGEVPTDGGEGTVNVSSGSILDEDNTPTLEHRAHGGAIYRMVASFDDSGPPHAVFNMARGNSGEPTDPHYDDLTSDWAEDRYSDLLFEDADIEASTEERITIQP